MLIVETISKIRRMHFNQGMGINTICRELNLSQKVVRKRSVLSDAGLEKFRAAFAIVSKVYLVNLDGISKEELETLMRLPQRIKDNVHCGEKY
jgi:predicted signal transduction protein with EAL and GGDEF domain